MRNTSQPTESLSHSAIGSKRSSKGVWPSKHMKPSRCSRVFEQGCLSALEKKLDWIPLILGDGHMPGSLVLKHYCEKCNTMPIVDGQ
eukprot:1451174-Karenia_brevis.AAC.1